MWKRKKPNIFNVSSGHAPTVHCSDRPWNILGENTVASNLHSNEGYKMCNICMHLLTTFTYYTLLCLFQGERGMLLPPLSNWISIDLMWDCPLDLFAPPLLLKFTAMLLPPLEWNSLYLVGLRCWCTLAEHIYIYIAWSGHGREVGHTIDTNNTSILSILKPFFSNLAIFVSIPLCFG